MTAAGTQVWRTALFGRVLASAIAPAPAAGAVAAVSRAAVHPTGERVAGALVTVGSAALFGLVLWWMAYRSRMVLTGDALIVINPWGTSRVAVTEVVAVIPGLVGARLELRSGWSVTVFALAQAYGGGHGWGRRVAEVVDAIAARRRALGVG